MAAFSVLWRIVMPIAFAATATISARGEEAIDFARDVQPLLKAHCFKCHGQLKQQGGLRLDLKASALKGGDSGERGIVPGRALQSRVIQLVASKDDNERMPPEGEPLTAAQIELLKRWVDSGAVWPESEATTAKPIHSEMVVTEEDRQHWSFQRLKKIAPPDVKDGIWVRTPVDRFIRSAQEKKGLTPAAPADARVLIRRVYFDLIGLPPALKESAGKWKEERLDIDIEPSSLMANPAALATVVDKLLASPHYGERWARHWLDVARYADSNGMESDHDRPNAYRFRDFVIRALNGDMPFDRFVRWQLAGDELAPDNPDAIAATGFVVAGVSEMLNVPMVEEKLRLRANELDDMVSTTGQALLGLTIGCARCHDHKYDPIPTRDYYRLMRVFNSGDRKEVPLAPPIEVQSHRQAMAVWQTRMNAALKQRDEWLKEARVPISDQVRAAKIAKLPATGQEKRLLRDKPDAPEARQLANRFKKELQVVDADYVAALPDEQKARWDELSGPVKEIAARKPNPLPTAFAFADFAPEPRETWFFERGDFLARNERMELGFLSALTNDKSADEYWTAARTSKLREDSTQQRRALADWTTDLEHGAGTLLARVMVNRVWQHHFGEGLVRTVNDFGTRGDPPTHPELLEWLTGEFVRSGWSLKHLHRLIVNGAVYRQGIAPNEANAAIDPENRLLWRRRPQRLEAEALRDSMLAVAGSLNPTMYGPSNKPPIPGEAMQARNVQNPYPRDVQDSPETRRRSIYLFHKRVVQYPLMQAFDAPDAQVSCGRRVNTTVAPQALALLNDPFVRLRAGELARRLQREAGKESEAQVRRAFQWGLAREPAADELHAAQTFITAQSTARRQRDAKLSVEAARQLALSDFCQMLLALNEFIYID